MTDLQDVVMAAQRLKWKWGGHVSRLNTSRWAYVTTMWDPRTGKRTAGRPRTRRSDFFRRSLRRIDIVTFKPGDTKDYILDPTIRFETHQNQPEEINLEKSAIYEPTIPHYKTSYKLRDIEVMELMGWAPEANPDSKRGCLIFIRDGIIAARYSAGKKEVEEKSYGSLVVRINQFSYVAAEYRTDQNFHVRAKRAPASTRDVDGMM
ncbi:hypothetical protein ANN_06728 [Periplaneta americana]|uniref:Uncharacterized protein n=1 Tax=Periplaneta americana TaxID=6978 RepID=A0ABQ8TEZ3_PERAM|nr:hypothetical protein ANN_06728 [Periplaneta americana]